jgi:hypothetical protein
MPAVVQRYIDTRDIRLVMSEQKKILVEYRKDISQYDEENAMRIREVFRRLAPELSKKNKRFYAGGVSEGARFDRLEDEYIVEKCNEETHLLRGSALHWHRHGGKFCHRDRRYGRLRP